MREIGTDRLILQNFTADDSADLFALIADYRNSPTYRFDHPWPEAFDEYGKIATWFSSGDEYLAVRLRADDAFLGFVNLTQEPETNRFNLGFIFHSQHHHQGYAFEACQAYLEFLRSMPQDIQFVTGTAAENKPAHRLLLRLGFTVVKEGRGSFQKDEQGRPVEFQGFEYRC